MAQTAVCGPIDQAIAIAPIHLYQGITEVALRVALPIRLPESGSGAGERCDASRGERWQRHNAARGCRN